jgi:hypothetical protein
MTQQQLTTSCITEQVHYSKQEQYDTVKFQLSTCRIFPNRSVFFDINGLLMLVSRTLTSPTMCSITLEPKPLYCHQEKASWHAHMRYHHDARQCLSHVAYCPEYSRLPAMEDVELSPTQPRAAIILFPCFQPLKIVIEGCNSCWIHSKTTVVLEAAYEVLCRGNPMFFTFLPEQSQKRFHLNKSHTFVGSSQDSLMRYTYIIKILDMGINDTG